MSSELHVAKGQPDADELAAVVIALDLVRARSQEVKPVSRWQSSLRRKPGAARGITTWAHSRGAR